MSDAGEILEVIPVSDGIIMPIYLMRDHWKRLTRSWLCTRLIKALPLAMKLLFHLK
jgi:hypothetical protein